MKIKISPSILSADFACLGSECKRVCDGGADLVHVDVMDGSFVPNITIGAPVVRAIKPYSKLPLDVHLMINSPERFIDDFVESGADIITVHAEATDKLDEIIDRLHEKGVKASVSIKPETSVEVVFPYLKKLEMVLIMTVEPGFGGQKLIESVLPKITAIRNRCKAERSDIDIEVDGGITRNNISCVAAAGANVFVAGSAVFGSDDIGEAIKTLKSNAVRQYAEKETSCGQEVIE